MYVVGAGILGLAAYHHAIGLGTVAVMLPMFPSTMQVGGVSAADASLEQMLASVPDLDEVSTTSSSGRSGTGRADARGLPARQIRFERVSYQYPARGPGRP